MTEAWVESELRDGTRWRWTFEPDEAGVLPVSGRDEVYPIFVLRCGDRIRQAFVTSEVAQSPRYRKSVYGNMAMWDADEPDVPALRLYIYGTTRYPDGTVHDGLALVMFTLEGKMVGVYPVQTVAL